jgi:hypothetical protein
MIISLHDIKYFFSTKIIKQSRKTKKKFRRGRDILPKILLKNIIFQNLEGTTALPPTSMDLPLIGGMGHFHQHYPQSNKSRIYMMAICIKESYI